MVDIVNIDDFRPHITKPIQCECGKNWVAVYPEGTDYLECPGCHQMVNEYGVSVFVNTCKTCGNKYTVTPAPKNIEDWQHCLDPSCGSYDESRDADKLFE